MDVIFHVWVDVTLSTLGFQVIERCRFWKPLQKLKGFSSPTKLSTIGITILARMAFVKYLFVASINQSPFLFIIGVIF